MQFMKSKLKCHDCIKPLSRRLGLFQANDEYECYAESYVKCFWSLCDHQESVESFRKTSPEKVITAQPISEKVKEKNAIVKEMAIVTKL